MGFGSSMKELSRSCGVFRLGVLLFNKFIKANNPPEGSAPGNVGGWPSL